jgi:hypothetical protein
MLQQAKSFRLLTRVPSDGERGPIAAVFIFAGAPVFGCVKVRSVILEEIPVSFGRSCDQRMRDVAALRNFPIAPMCPLRILHELKHRPALVLVGARNAVRSVGTAREQHGIVQASTPDRG